MIGNVVVLMVGHFLLDRYFDLKLKVVALLVTVFDLRFG